MKKKLLFSCSILVSCFGMAQVSGPFTACPEVVAVARPGTNTYANNPVSLYNVNSTTGAATLIPGGPLKNPASPANNMDLNGVGLNSQDGYLYGMGANVSTAQKFYRIGSNYSVQQVGVITPPPVSGLFDLGIVNPAAGEFDASGNYFFTAVSGFGIPFPTPTFFPTDFYIGKIPNATSLRAGTANITPVYTALDFSAAACSPYYFTLVAAVTQTTAENTGIRDLVFNPRDGKLYTYVTYEFPSGSGTFFGELLSVNTSTGVVTCYSPTLLPFASATNEVAGTAMTTSGAILVLFTGGNIYKTVFTAPNTYSGAIVPAGPSGIGTALRGDLAACVTANAILPVKFESVTATENKCVVDLRFTVAGEENVNRYDVEELDNNHPVSIAKITALNDPLEHTYRVSLPVNAKTMVLRIRETDFDGSAVYSDAVTVNTNCSQTESITVIENAAVGDNLQLRWNNVLSAENFTVNVFSSAGTLMTKKAVEVNGFSNITNMDVSKLAPGLYLVTAQSATGERFTEKFIKK